MWSYDNTDLDTSTASGRLNSIRLLVGDTDTLDQQLQDEEINFALGESSGNVYYAAAFCCKLLASKYARMVDTQLDGALEARYSTRIKQYNLLGSQLSNLGKQASGKTLGVFAGGISVADRTQHEEKTDRVKPSFTIEQFDYPGEE